MPYFLHKQTFKQKKRINFSDYDSTERHYDAKLFKNYYLGVGLKVTELSEYKTVKEPISRETAVEFAKRALEKEIARELLPPAQLVKEDVDVKEMNADTISVTVTMDFTEQIGTEKLIEEVTVVEPKNNQSAGGD